ncbi:hypothetical protein B0H13DRAFT_2236246 [Mycena leptocephala]|nr:hypothetical protein B0H13DRAFT_2236246 [Mycena leptocephala]
MQPKVSTRLKAQRSKQPPVVRADLTGKTVCILGANTGIGFQACKHFATMNPGRIILACRSKARGQEAVESAFSQFRDEFEKDGGRLDILIANAAVEPGRYIETKDGWESTLQVNHLGTSFAVLLLLPTILRTAHEHSTVPRIVIVTSELHYDVIVEKEARARPGKILQTLSNAEYLKRTKPMRTQYSVTKLINLFFVRALAARLGPSAPVIVDAVAPGFCVSELRRDLAGGFKYMVKLMEWILALTTEEGSRRLVWAAIGLPNAEDTLRGQYINCCTVEEPSDFVIGAEGHKVQEDLWVETIDVLRKLDPQIDAVTERYLSG